MMKKINEIPGKNPFKVPENYFEEVNRKILSDTSGFKHEIKKDGFYRRFRTQFAVAASVTGFIILGYTAVNLLKYRQNNIQVSEIVNTGNTEAFINDIDLITLEENAASLDLYEEGPAVSNNEIIDYLLLENIEISDIFEQL